MESYSRATQPELFNSPAREVLGHKNIQNTLIYITIDHALFQHLNDEFHVKTAKTWEEACKLAEVGFEYFDTIDGTHIYRKRK